MARLLQSAVELDHQARALVDGGPGARAALLVMAIDDYGALAGGLGSEDADRLVLEVADFIKTLLRDRDLLLVLPEGRLQAVLANATAEFGASIAERICAATRLHSFALASERLKLTLSIGVAGLPSHGRSVSEAFPLANTAAHRIEVQGHDGVGLAPRAAQAVAVRPLSLGRFAGRSAELDILFDALRTSLEGKPQVVAVRGEKGLGVTTLIRQMEPEARALGARFVYAASSESDPNDPYGAWCDLLHAIHRFPDPPRYGWSELPNMVPALRVDGNPPRRGSQHRMLEELTEFIRAVTVQSPLVMVLDDMQWAHGTTWEALEYLAAHLDNERVLIVLGMRAERQFSDATARRGESLALRPLYQEITLSRLTREEVKHWIEAVFNRQQVGRELLAFLYRHTEGNPLFIAQVLRSLLDEGLIWHGGDRWEWSPVSELRLPPGLEALIARRLGRFSASTMAVLAAAAVAGRSFDVLTVAETGVGSEAVVRLGFEEAMNAGLMRLTYERGSSGFEFIHDLIGAVLRETLPPPRLSELQARVALVAQKRGSKRLGEIAVLYDAAGSGAAAYESSVAAADYAAGLHATGAAHEYMLKAAHNAPDPAQLASVRVRLATMAEAAGRFDEVEELCDLVIEWFEGQGEERQAISARRMRERARLEQGQSARATLDALEPLERIAFEKGFEKERITILNWIAQMQSRLGRQSTAEQTLEGCIAAAEALGDEEVLADALTRLASVLVQRAPERVEPLYRRALGLYEQLSDLRGQVRCYNNIAAVNERLGNTEEAAKGFSVAMSISRAAGMLDQWGASSNNLGVTLQKRGLYKEALQCFGEAIAALSKAKNAGLQVMALYNMAHCERDAEAYESAAELYASTIPLARRIGQADVELGAMAGTGICCLATGRYAEALRYVDDLEPRLRDVADWFQGREAVESFLIRVAVHRGDVDAAVARLGEAMVAAAASGAYAAAWLLAECGPLLVANRPEPIRRWVKEYVPAVTKLGYPALTRRFEALSHS